MSAVTNRRDLGEAVQVLIKARQPTSEQVDAVFYALEKVVSDLTGEDIEVVIRIKAAPASQPSKGGSNG